MGIWLDLPGIDVFFFVDLWDCWLEKCQQLMCFFCCFMGLSWDQVILKLSIS
jgi:hypothetical protein